MSVVLAAFSREILYVLFGSPDGFSSLMILSVGMLFYSLFFVGYSALQGLGRPEWSMGIAVAAALCNIFLCFQLIPHSGLVGAAVATSVSCGLGMGFVLGSLKVVVVPRIQYGVVLLPLVIFEHFLGILESRVLTMVVYGGVGLAFIGLYFWLSKKYLRS